MKKKLSPQPVEDMENKEFKQYRRSNIAEMRPYIQGELLPLVSISLADSENGSPLVGDMIARNPNNHNDQWLVAEEYFKENFEPLQSSQKPSQPERTAEALEGHLQGFETMMFSAFLQGKEQGHFKDWYERNDFKTIFLHAMQEYRDQNSEK